MSYTHMTNHKVKVTSRGVHVRTLALVFTMPGGDGVLFDAPLLMLTDRLAITPDIAPDSPTTLRINLALWSPVYLDETTVARFPVGFHDQATAVRVCRDFDADPTTSWHDPADVIQAWLTAWAAAAGSTLTDSSRSTDVAVEGGE
ncbi:MAG TPA: hypothetical protein VM677_03045 [Actinokineospora sp.]|nr:hypothetical protein [Actinokineospora sp.]